MSKNKRTVTLIKGNGAPMIAKSTNRNARCLCGSGKKQKHCCGNSKKYFYSKKMGMQMNQSISE